MTGQTSGPVCLLLGFGVVPDRLCDFKQRVGDGRQTLPQGLGLFRLPVPDRCQFRVVVRPVTVRAQICHGV